MRWLLLKDLQILKRSPLVVALLVIYPIALGVLIGFALSGDDSKPKVAFLNEATKTEDLNLGVGDDSFGSSDARSELCGRVDCINVSSRAEAEKMVQDGDVLGALILPPDLIDKLRSLTSLNPEQPEVEVLVNEDDPVKASLVDDRIKALVTEANLILSKQVSSQAGAYLDLLVKGGNFSVPFLGQDLDILGLDKTQTILQGVAKLVPPNSPQAAQLQRVERFAKLAGDNLGFALPLLDAVAEPIKVDKEVVSGDIPSLDTFAIAVAVTVTLMFVTVLLVAGSLALEREENAFARVTRASVGRNGLLAEKLALGVVASMVVTLLTLVALSIFVSISWSRIGLILVAIVVGGAAFAAFGAAIGSAAREVRASSLLAFMVSLPIAFLSLVPSGSVSGGAFQAIEIVRALFPFDPALDAMSSGLDSGAAGIGLPLLHLAAIIAAYGLLARVALRRLA